VASKRWEAIVTTGLGLIVWIWRLTASHSIAAFVRNTTLTMVSALAATVLIMMAVEVWARPKAMLRRRVRP
jgi:small neutral amino acid transporter SnatA (MarC family)